MYDLALNVAIYTHKLFYLKITKFQINIKTKTQKYVHKAEYFNYAVMQSILLIQTNCQTHNKINILMSVQWNIFKYRLESKLQENYMLLSLLIIYSKVQ